MNLISPIEKTELLNLHLEAEESHHPDLYLAGLITQVCVDVLNAVKHTGNNRHGEDRRTRAVLNNGPCLRVLRPQHIQRLEGNKKDISENNKSKRRELTQFDSQWLKGHLNPYLEAS